MAYIYLHSLQPLNLPLLKEEPWLPRPFASFIIPIPELFIYFLGKRRGVPASTLVSDITVKYVACQDYLRLVEPNPVLEEEAENLIDG